MDELIKELTLLAKAAREYLERPTQLTLPLIPEAEEEKPKRTRKAKAEPIVVPQPEEPQEAADPMVQAESPKGGISEEESKAELDMMVKAVMRTYPDLVEGKPQGFHLARKILSNDFKVAKTADLVHAQRIQFVTKLKALVAKAPAAAGV